jgi:ATP-binding cassette subfamily F protein 3
MEKIEDPAISYGDGENLAFRFPSVGALRRDELVRLDNVTFGYPGSDPLFVNATLHIDLKSRMGVLGRNGAGKSTLLKVMIGELTAQKGAVTVNRNMRIALFAQHHVDTLDLKNTCVECVQARFPGLPDQEVRNMLGRFGIQGDMAMRRIKTLSGGQKSRVALTIITQCQPHMIVLDEPTNHLDMESIDSLIEAVENFDGAVVFVSHDQYFLSKIATELVAVANGAVRIFRDLEEAKQFTYKACEVR